MIIRRNSPFIHTEKNTPFLYMNMLIAIFPCMIYSVLSYGLRAFVLIGICSVLSLFISRMNDRHKGLSVVEYYDISALYSGVVLAMLLPPGTGILWAVIAVIFSEVVFKQLFGGLGSNPVNNPIAAILVMNLAFDSKMNGYLKPGKDLLGVDSLLNMSTTDGRTGIDGLSFYEIVSGNYMGLMGTGCTIMILIGLAYLIYKHVVRLEAPIAYIAVVSVMVIADNKLNIFKLSELREFAIVMASSGVLFVASYMLSDVTTIAHGRIVGVISGVLAGIMAFVCMRISNPMVALAVPVLITNIAATIIEYIASSFYRKRGGLL